MTAPERFAEMPDFSIAPRAPSIHERVRLFGPRSADYIRASGHSGCIATEVVLQAKQAEYMTAPERFAEMPDFSLAPRAPSIHDPSATLAVHRSNGFDTDFSPYR